MANNRIMQLDALRGIAAIAVAFFWHYVHFFTYGNSSERLTAENRFLVLPFYRIFHWFYDYGDICVDFFFVLSGFIFMIVYGRKISKKEISFYDFFIKRFSRIYPLHFLTLMIVVLELWYMANVKTSFIYTHNDFFHFILNVLMLQAGWFDMWQTFNGPSWSIAIEFAGYMMFFLILRLNETWRFKSNLIFGLLIYFGAYQIYGGGNYFIYNDMMSRIFLGFFIGCLASQVYGIILESNKFSIIFQVFAIFVMLVTVSGSIRFGFQEFFGAYKVIMPMVIFPLIIIFCAINRVAKNILSLKLFEILGACSFSIYLCHYPIQIILRFVFERFNLSPELYFTWMFYVFCVLVISCTCHYLYEIPMQRIIREKYLKSQ